MDDRPSFRRRKDLLQLAGALAAPWLTLGMMLAPLQILFCIYGRGHPELRNYSGFLMIWGLCGFALIMLVPLVLSLIGIWRLFWYRSYRHSLFGWLWPPLVFSNMGLVGGALGH